MGWARPRRAVGAASAGLGRVTGPPYGPSWIGSADYQPQPLIPPVERWHQPATNAERPRQPRPQRAKFRRNPQVLRMFVPHVGIRSIARICSTAFSCIAARRLMRKPLNIDSLSVYVGPNVHAREAVIRFQLDVRPSYAETPHGAGGPT